MDICSSPQLFAAYHVFHRLLVPRHPPCALFCLTSFRFYSVRNVGFAFIKRGLFTNIVNRLVCYFSDVLIKIFILFKISFCMKFSRYKSHSSPPCRSIPLTLHFAHGHSPYNLFATALRLCKHIEICVLSLHGSLLSCKWRWRDSNS